MTETSGSLPANKAQREQLLALYWLEEYLFDVVHGNFERGEPINKFDFYCIVYWKRNASKTRIKNGLAKLGKTSGDLLDEVRQAQKLEEKFAVLTKVNGIGVAIASAILAVCYPEKYTVVDSYVLNMLKKDKHLSDGSLTVEGYREYNEWCKEQSSKHDMSLRDVDRALWANAWKERLVP